MNTLPRRSVARNVWRFFKLWWSDILAAFGENVALKRTEKNFKLPESYAELDPSLKRKLTICNLFANQNQPLEDIARALELKKGFVISTLLEQGLIEERRKRAAQPRESDRRGGIQT